MQDSDSIDDLREKAEIYVINSDALEQSTQLRQIAGTTLPILLDQDPEVARSYDFLPKAG